MEVTHLWSLALKLLQGSQLTLEKNLQDTQQNPNENWWQHVLQVQNRAGKGGTEEASGTGWTLLRLCRKASRGVTPGPTVTKRRGMQTAMVKGPASPARPVAPGGQRQSVHSPKEHTTKNMAWLVLLGRSSLPHPVGPVSNTLVTMMDV